MGGKSERFIMRVEAETLAAWRVEAVASDTSVAALITRRMDTQASDRGVVDGAVQAYQTALAAKDDEIASLKKALATRGVVAAVLPLTGTEFPARPVYLRGQDPGKGKR